jgi:hypothetical protein
MTNRLSRRRLLLGGGTLALLAGCGFDAAKPQPLLVNLFSTDRVLVAGRPQRVPFAVVDNKAVQLADDAELPVRILQAAKTIDTLTVQARIVNHEHVDPTINPNHQHSDLLRYFALRAIFPNPGIYDLEVDFGSAGVASLPVQAFDPAEVEVALPGAPLPHLDTPTLANPEGINPLCTRAPEPCPLHRLSVADVLDRNRPLALLVATPALCQTAYCGPVLETLLGEAANFPALTMIHLEVYANAADVGGNYNDPNLELAQPVKDLGLTFEPSLFLVGADGVIADRIDNLFDTTELRAGLESLR